MKPGTISGDWEKLILQTLNEQARGSGTVG
jgi:hypothetical protein